MAFFNKLRKEMPDSGSLRRYVLYAFGEIILVVIGILIALQINKWNEYRKDRKEEKLLLQQLHDEFLNHKKELERILSINKQSMQIYEDAIALFPIDPGSIDRDTLNKYLGHELILGTATINSSNAIVSAITSNNAFDLISDPGLRNKILSWIGVIEDYLEDEENIIRYTRENIRDYLVDHGFNLERGFLDDRVDISFLTTPEFESRMHMRLHLLRNLYDAGYNINLFPELEIMQKTIDEIIEMTAPNQ